MTDSARLRKKRVQTQINFIKRKRERKKTHYHGHHRNIKDYERLL